MIKITEEVRAFVAESGVTNGLAAVVTAHTTTGIMVNEGLECVETDIEEALERLIPKDAPYAHAHFLPSYGATGSNSPSHLKSMLSGNSCLFVVQDGKMVTGDAQDVYLAEFDGPKARKVYIQVLGE
ncbi:secondary thiamine-phosphate synthase enzyme YjbQ [Paenibacillus konkukensis]